MRIQNNINNKRSSKTNQPLVSVVMPVYNAGNFLVEAIKSILSQTYKNFEFIIVDDASTDNSWKILKQYARKNKKIKLFRNSENLGVSVTVKRAISESKGNFIARMDADDISFPDRLEKQIKYLLSHKTTVALGGQCLLIDKKGRVIGAKTFPTKFEDIYKYIFQFVPVQQPTLIISRKRLPKSFEYYKDGMNTAEEIELIFKLFLYGKVENLQDVVLNYRLHDNNTSLRNLRTTFYYTLVARLNALLRYKYKPTFQGVIATILQTFLVFTLPKRVLTGLYFLTKGIKKPSFSLSFRNPIRLDSTFLRVKGALAAFFA